MTEVSAHAEQTSSAAGAARQSANDLSQLAARVQGMARQFTY